ncbi:hypothetical protein L6452_02860 [Arctium lappa]|uniref:Uncharacterized protein n=1 Tax=Arctium lappa TaxID=4217 RepID=A0ACB9FLL8_ARCLA|nr:hypothetical protein L6452_02860 [Arctium lappa]
MGDGGGGSGVTGLFIASIQQQSATFQRSHHRSPAPHFSNRRSSLLSSGIKIELCLCIFAHKYLQTNLISKGTTESEALRRRLSSPSQFVFQVFRKLGFLLVNFIRYDVGNGGC